MLKFAKRFPDAFMFLIIVGLIAVFCMYEIPDDVSGEFSSWNVREDAVWGSENFINFYLAVFCLVFGLPAAILLLSRRITGSWDRAGLWLRFLWISFGFALLMLVCKVIIYDEYLIEYGIFSSFAGGLNDLFGFSLTLYAFVAGFILFYCLQEYSNISKDFKQELGAWHAMFDLLRFFQKRPEDSEDLEAVDDKNQKYIDRNDDAAWLGMSEIASIEPSKMAASENPDQFLDKVYDQILRFTAVDSNDQPALDALIQKYSTLRVLLHQRKDRNVKSPNMLVFVVWIVAVINIVLASLAVLSLFEFCNFEDIEKLAAAGGAVEDCENGPIQAIQRLVLSVCISIIVLPITMINLTIYDLRNPFTGDWKIDVPKEYTVLVGQLAELNAEMRKLAGKSELIEPMP